MLRIEEIVGAMDDEFRYALDALGDDRLAELAADKAALRRLRPVGVSHAEAMAMIAAIQARREAARERQAQEERRQAARAARRKSNPRKAAPGKSRAKAVADAAALAEPGAALAEPAATATTTLPGPPAMVRLAPPRPTGPAIRLPPPAAESAAIPLPTPTAAPVAAPPTADADADAAAVTTPRRPSRPHVRLAVMLALGVLAALALAVL